MFFAIVGALFFCLFCWVLFSRKNKALIIENKTLLTEKIELEKSLARLQAQKEALKDAQTELKREFENLSAKIYDSNAKRFKEESEKNLQMILSPLKEKLSEFQKQVESSYQSEARERFALKKELEKMVSTNHKISEEAHNLTRAFKGDVKAQGTWGEMVLESILDSSGLRKGEEYTVQGKDLKLMGEDGRRQQPDVIINLPEKKHLIIDSKVSLVSYERYLSEELPTEREKHVKDLIKSFEQHIEGLHRKNYSNIEGIHAPDFVLLFVPIEGIFSFSLEKAPKLFTYGWDRSIMLVSPSTLLATLRTIGSIWKYDRQNKNTLEIAKQGGLLYDRFASLAVELERLGDLFGKASNQYDDLMRKLKTGRGNLMSRAENLKKLGAKTTKSLPADELIEITPE